MNEIDRIPSREERNWEAVSEAVSDAYFPHRLSPHEAGSTAEGASVAALDLGHVRIAQITWGAEVSVSSDHPNAYAVNVPEGGVLETRIGARTIHSTKGSATVNPPDTPTRITRWSRGCAIVGIRIDRDFLRHEVSRVTGEADAAVPAQIDLTTPQGASWLRLVSSIARQPVDDPLLTHPLVAEHLAGSLTDAFLLAALPVDPGDCRAPRPRIVTRVLDALHADPARAWSAADMAEIAGVSIRRLQEGFREYVGRTPRECLTDIRLGRAHDQLSAYPESSVTDVALACGFGHTGRFAAAFRRRYGVPPSELARRA